MYAAVIRNVGPRWGFMKEAGNLKGLWRIQN